MVLGNRSPLLLESPLHSEAAAFGVVTDSTMRDCFVESQTGM